MLEPSEDPFLKLKNNTQQVLAWPAFDLEKEMWRLIATAITVLVERAHNRSHGEQPTPTAWPGVLSGDVLALAHAAYTDYKGWLVNKDRQPVPWGEADNRGSGVNSAASVRRRKSQDRIRLTLVCGALSGWRAMTSLEGIHHSLDIFDGVTRAELGSQKVFRRTRINGLSDDERDSVRRLANNLSLSRMGDLLNVAANYRLTYRLLNGTPGPHAQTYLAQRETTALTTIDPIVLDLARFVDGQSSRFERMWELRAGGG